MGRGDIRRRPRAAETLRLCSETAGSSRRAGTAYGDKVYLWDRKFLLGAEASCLFPSNDESGVVETEAPGIDVATILPMIHCIGRSVGAMMTNNFRAFAACGCGDDWGSDFHARVGRGGSVPAGTFSPIPSASSSSGCGPPPGASLRGSAPGERWRRSGGRTWSGTPTKRPGPGGRDPAPCPALPRQPAPLRAARRTAKSFSIDTRSAAQKVTTDDPAECHVHARFPSSDPDAFLKRLLPFVPRS